ncbi:MAG: hypothetical protein AB7L94_07910 [Kofleriaceae bacterium]
MACAAYTWAHHAHGVPIARSVLGIAVSEAGFVVQLVALVLGAACLPLVAARHRRWLLIAQGAICVIAWGVAGAAFLAVLVGLWATLELRAIGRARFVIAVGAIAAPSGCAIAGGEVAAAGLVFSVMFGMRLAVYGYERFQDDTPVPIADFLAYMLVAPLIVVPPYMAFVPLFASFELPAPTRARLAAAGRHLALAVVFGAALAAARSLFDSLDGEILRFYGRLVVELLDFAALVHLVLAALLAHGIELRSPIDRPAFSTSFLDLWRRFGSHLREAQMFLFYTPVVLRLRRVNRYVVLIAAAAWTMIVGNTLLHVVIRYCFLADPWPRIGAALIANTLMAMAIAIELCLEEKRRRSGRERTMWGRIVGWAVAMTLAATVLAL